MITACSTVQAVCAAWRQQGQELNHAAFAVSVGSPEALQAVSTLLLACTLCPSNLFDNTTETSSSSAASTAMRVVKVLEPNTSASARQAAWQYACTHQSELSELQHQALHMLGCSGRALMYAAQEGLSPIVSPLTVGLAYHSWSRLAQHWPALPKLAELSQPRQLQQLAEALTQLKEGDSPPCGSRLATCAALLWLVRAVLLEWVQQQPVDWPSAFSADWASHMFSMYYGRVCLASGADALAVLGLCCMLL
jgi:hypothetical protein